MKRFFFIFTFTMLLATSVSAQVSLLLGDWITVDDKTGEKRSVVTLYKGQNGAYYGKVAKLLVGDPKVVCTACEGEEHNQAVEGMVIIRGMKFDKEENQLVGGKVLDPESGKFYYAKIYIKDGKLVLRGSLDKRGFLGRNQTWVRK